MSKKFKHSDEVWHRVVQIVQEAMIMGIDCVDLLRMIEVQEDHDTGELALTTEYVKSVDQMHAKWLEEATKLKQEQEKNLADHATQNSIFVNVKSN